MHHFGSESLGPFTFPLYSSTNVCQAEGKDAEIMDLNHVSETWNSGEFIDTVAIGLQGVKVL